MIKDFVIMAKKIKQDGREFDVIHGEVVPHPDVLGERSGECTTQLLSATRPAHCKCRPRTVP